MYGFYYAASQQPPTSNLYFPPPPRSHQRQRPHTSSPLARSQSCDLGKKKKESVKEILSRWSGITFIKRKIDEWIGEKEERKQRETPRKRFFPLTQDQLDGVRLRTVDQSVPKKMEEAVFDAEHVKDIADKIDCKSHEAFIQRLLDLSCSAGFDNQYFLQVDPKNPDKHIITTSQRYDFHHTIGSGSFSKVKLAKDLEQDGKWLAIKLINATKIRLNGRLQKTLARELGILSRVKHGAIVRFEGLFVVRGYICLAMEYVQGGELFKAISELNGRGIKETEARDILRQLLSAVLYLHSVGVVHRDLKLENILICDDDDGGDELKIKLVDFGLGRPFREGQLLETRCGSEEYAAPEVIRGLPYNGKLTDAWSFGVIMYACLTGQLPFNPDHQSTLGAKIVSGRFWIDETAISQPAVQIIRGLLMVDPAKRLSLQELRDHHYFM